MTAPTFSQQDHQLPHGVLRVRSGGDGRPVVHLHSAAGPRITPVIAQLSRAHRVHCPIAPGFDGQPALADVATIDAVADFVAAFIRTACEGRCDVIGESFGGWIALWLAVKHPDLIGQLVLEAPAGLRATGEGGLPDDAAERLKRLYAQPGNAPPETRPEAVLMANRRATLGYTKGVAFDAALADRLTAIRARTLILMGTQDGIIPASTGHLLKSRIALSHLIYMHGAAHAIEIDQPQRTAALIGDFLDRGESFLVRER